MICLKRPICANKELSISGTYNIVCGALAGYLSPNGLVITLRYIHVRKIFKNLRDVRWEWGGKPGGWLNIPGWLLRM